MQVNVSKGIPIVLSQVDAPYTWSLNKTIHSCTRKILTCQKASPFSDPNYTPLPLYTTTDLDIFLHRTHCMRQNASASTYSNTRPFTRLIFTQNTFNASNGLCILLSQADSPSLKVDNRTTCLCTNHIRNKASASSSFYSTWNGCPFPYTEQHKKINTSTCLCIVLS